jgi:hypothetical protein
MTRRSKRELERALEEIDAENSRERTTPKIEEHCSEDVVEFVYDVCRDLFRIVNEKEPEATWNFFQLVRKEYDVDDDRDDDIVPLLLDATSQEKHWSPRDSFAAAPVRVATELDLETDAGETLAELVDDGREEEAEQLLIGATYELLAADSGAPAEAPA